MTPMDYRQSLHLFVKETKDKRWKPRHRKRLPKHRTIRKHSSGQKTLTQVLKELTLGI